jgi:hypothetical protein
MHTMLVQPTCACMTHDVSCSPFELQYTMLSTDEQQELNRLRNKYKVTP